MSEYRSYETPPKTIKVEKNTLNKCKKDLFDLFIKQVNFIVEENGEFKMLHSLFMENGILCLKERIRKVMKKREKCLMGDKKSLTPLIVLMLLHEKSEKSFTIIHCFNKKNVGYWFIHDGLIKDFQINQMDRTRYVSYESLIKEIKIRCPKLENIMKRTD